MSKPPSIPTNTNLITELDVATAALLAKRTGTLELNGIKSLTPEVARELGQFQGEYLLLQNLLSLPADVAEELLPLGERLQIAELELDDDGTYPIGHLLGEELHPSVAKLLVAISGSSRSYTILEHTHIGPEAAEQLANMPDGPTVLELCGIRQLPAALYRPLSRIRAMLRLPNLERMSVDAACAFGRENASLHVSASTLFDTEALRAIMTSKGRIELNAPDVHLHHASAFPTALCDLDLGQLCVPLTENAANQLARAACPSISLAVPSMSGAVAAALSRSRACMLKIGVNSLDDDAAQALAAYSGFLWLPDMHSWKEAPGHVALANKLESVAAPIIDSLSEYPALLGALSLYVKQLRGWPIAWPTGFGMYNLECVEVVGDCPGLATVAGMGSTWRFPKLRSLAIKNCSTVRELDFTGGRGAQSIEKPPLSIEVAQCNRLEKLSIMTERCCASRLKIAGLPKCEVVHLSIPDLPDLRVLAEVVNIKHVGVYRSPALKSLDGVQKLKRLTYFRLEACHQIEDLRQLQNLQGIEELTLEDCPGIASLDVVATLPSLYAITLIGPTRISSLHCLRYRDDVSVSIQGAMIGVPPSVIKADYYHNGVDCLVRYENAIVECHQCGGQSFEGACSGWYQRTGGARVKRSASLDGVDYIGSAKALFSSLESDAQSENLRYAKQRDEFYQFPELHAKVACVACGAIFDPASFGANAENEFEAGDAAEQSESAASRPDDGMRDWSEIGAERSINVSVRHLRHMRLRFSVNGNEAERPVSEAGKCPICCEADLKLSISGRAQRETAGKFSGHVVIDRTPWSELPNCFHFDEGDEKTGGSWEWSHMPRASRDMRMSCANGCFESPVSAPEQVPHVLLASLAMFEAQRAQPDQDLLAGWIGGLAKTAGKPEKLVLGAVAHIDNIDPESVPRASESADPKKAALELCAKAKALLDQALALAKKPKTRERSRPQAKPKEQQGVGEGPLAGRVFCFTGRLEGMSRAEAEDKVKALGAATADSITKKVTDVVVGADAGSKRAKALELGLKVHDQEGFEALLRGLG